MRRNTIVRLSAFLLAASLTLNAQALPSPRFIVLDGGRVAGTVHDPAELEGVAGGQVLRLAPWGVTGAPVQVRRANSGSRSTPRFRARHTYSAPAATAFTVADFNLDGYPDVALAGAAGVTVRLGQGNGEFGAAVSVFGEAATAMAAADLNGDGYPDLAAATAAGVVVLLRTSTGEFVLGAPVGRSANVTHILATDFNADAIPDLVLSGAGPVAIVPGVGDGSFSEAQHLAAPTATGPVAAADFDRDGRLDLVAASAVEPRLFVWRGLTPSGDLPLPAIAEALGVLDQGQAPHLSVRFAGRAGVNVLAGRGDFTFADPLPAEGVELATAGAATVDLDRDGAADQITLAEGVLTAAVRSAGNFTLSKTHVDPWTAGMPEAIFTITATGLGMATVSDTLPTGLTFVRASGPGWECLLPSPGQPITCLSGQLNGVSAPLSITVSVDANAPSVMTNRVEEAGGSFTTDTVVLNAGGGGPAPDLTVTKSHTGNFSRGQTGATYTVLVTNQGSATTSGLVTLREQPPAGLTVTSMSGADWACDITVLRCDNLLPLAAGQSYAPVTVTVTVAATAQGQLANFVEVAGGGDTNTSNNGAVDYTNVPGPDLIITKTHAGSFTQGQTGAQYLITVTNQGGGPTDGPSGTEVRVAEGPPAHFTLTGLSGVGWTCSVPDKQCYRSDLLAAGASYPSITATFSIDYESAENVTNFATLFGGGDNALANNTVGDTTTVTPAAADLTVSKTHNGTFYRYQNDATFTIQVSNVGPVPTVGPITITETVPAGSLNGGMSGTDWSCVAVTCTYNGVLSAGAFAPPITAVLRLNGEAAASSVNMATVAGGGDNTPGNNTASDTFAVTSADLEITKTHAGNFAPGQTGATYTIVVRNLSYIAPSPLSPVVTEEPPAGMTVTAMSGTNWTCSLALLTCSYRGVLQPLAVAEPITVTVNLAADASSTLTNTARVSTNFEFNTANDTAADVTYLTRDFRITKSHSGNFFQGQTGATYQIVVSHAAGGGSSGLIGMREHPPTGMTITSMSGPGWICVLLDFECETNAVLQPGGSLPPITVVASISGTAPGSLVNVATFSGGGDTDSTNNRSEDVTTILPANYDLEITKSHVGSFYRGQMNAAYTLNVRNAGTTPAGSNPLVTVVENPPAGMTVTSMSGSGWACALGTRTCTNMAAVAPGASLPPISVLATIATDAAAAITNSATVSGLGEVNPSNNTAQDVTAVVSGSDLRITKSHAGNFFQGQQGATYSLIVSNLGSASSGTITVTENPPAELTITAMTGAGWTCNAGTRTCTHPGPLNMGAALGEITVTGNISATAGTSITNRAAVQVGDDVNAANNEASDPTTVIGGLPDFIISKTHTGNAIQGQRGFQHQVVVTNIGGPGSTYGLTVIDEYRQASAANDFLIVTGAAGDGWTCSVATSRVTCTRTTDTIVAPGASLPTITVSSNVHRLIPSLWRTNASIRYLDFAEANFLNNRGDDLLSIDPVTGPDLEMNHGEPPGWNNHSFGIYNYGPTPTVNPITINFTPEAGLEITGLSGTDWTCTLTPASCTRTLPLATGLAPSITMTYSQPGAISIRYFRVDAAITTGDDAPYTTNNTLSIQVIAKPPLPDLAMIKSHTGSFTQGQTGTYSLTVHNFGVVVTSGAITVTEQPPAGLTISSMSGTGWTCTVASLTCTRSDVLDRDAQYPVITVLANIATNAAANLVNTARVDGANDYDLTNNSMADAATVLQTALNFSVAQGVATLNRTTGRFQQTVDITNNGSSVSGSAFVLDNLAAGVTLYQPSGATVNTIPAGSPYKEAGAINAGQTIRITLEFTRVGTPAITYTPRMLGPGSR